MGKISVIFLRGGYLRQLIHKLSHLDGDFLFTINNNFLEKFVYFATRDDHGIQFKFTPLEIGGLVCTRDIFGENIYVLQSEKLIPIYGYFNINVSSALHTVVNVWKRELGKKVHYWHTLSNYIIKSGCSLVDKSAYVYVTHTKEIHSWLPDDIREKCVWIRNNMLYDKN